MSSILGEITGGAPRRSLEVVGGAHARSGSACPAPCFHGYGIAFATRSTSRTVRPGAPHPAGHRPPRARVRDRVVAHAPRQAARPPMTTALLFVASLILVVVASELFTNAIEWAGFQLKLGTGATGSLLAALGTSLPETVVPIVALATHSPGADSVATGAVLGSPFLLLDARRRSDRHRGAHPRRQRAAWWSIHARRVATSVCFSAAFTRRGAFQRAAARRRGSSSASGCCIAYAVYVVATLRGSGRGRPARNRCTSSAGVRASRTPARHAAAGDRGRDPHLRVAALRHRARSDASALHVGAARARARHRPDRDRASRDAQQRALGAHRRRHARVRQRRGIGDVSVLRPRRNRHDRSRRGIRAPPG